MKQAFFLAVCLAGPLVPAMLLPCADGQSVRTKGTVLILHNDRAITGDIERVSDGYLVRHEGELWLPAREVKCLCADWNEALAVMRSQANLLDPDERLRLAKWCEQSGQFPQAIDEVKHALQMRPKHGPTQQYLYYLEHAAEMANRRPAPATAKKDSDLPPSLDLSADALSLFVTKVQPILMNTCAQCHAGGQGGQFQLARVSGIGAAWQRATQVNMTAAVRQINLENAEMSPLLWKAVSRHGTATKAPLAGRAAPPYQILKLWVDITIATNPHLRLELNQTAAGTLKLPSPFAPSAVGSVATAPGVPGPLPDLGPGVQPIGPAPFAPEKSAPTASGFAASEKTNTPGKDSVIQAVYTTTAGQETGQIQPVVRTTPTFPSTPVTPPALAPAPKCGPPDPYDPDEYNRMVHPGKN